MESEEEVAVALLAVVPEEPAEEPGPRPVTPEAMARGVGVADPARKLTY